VAIQDVRADVLAFVETLQKRDILQAVPPNGAH
jgi:hypothetical protein